MKRRDLDRLARNPKLIAGIYNYCDRWCERCQFTDRCLNYAMEEENRQSGGAPKDKAAFWKRFEASLKLTREMVHDMAKERGIAFDPAELEEAGRKVERKRRAAEKHPIARAAM